MITKGYIISKSKEASNKYSVRIPLFESAGTNKNSISECTLCANPGTYEGLKAGDCVFVSFEDNKLSKPIILGKLFTGIEADSSAFQYNSDLTVTHKAVLPADTTIGSIRFDNISKYFDTINEALDKKDIFVNSIQFKTDTVGAGLVNFSDDEGVLEVSLSPNVTMGVGIDTVLKVYNDTAYEMLDGQVVYNSGNIDGVTKVKLAIADNHVIANSTLGVVTEHIPSHGYGFISRGGYVGGILLDPATYYANDVLYLSPTVAGAFTNVKPDAPNFVTQVGRANIISSDGSTADGQVYVDVVIIPISSDISYDNSDAELEAQNVKSALDELSHDKADISMLSSNITLYRTVTDSDIPTYRKLVTSTADPDYPTVAVEVSSGAITGLDQYISGSVSAPGLFVGNPGQINIFSVGRVKKTSGNNNQNAEFFFRVYRRDSGGTEHLVATSATTGVVSSAEWLVFNAIALLNNGEFTATDRIVVKSYANYVGNPGGIFAYEFGGSDNPFRLLIPVPVSVIPTALAVGVNTDISQFNTILSSSDTNVQAALNTLDKHTHPNMLNHSLLNNRDVENSHPSTAISYDNLISGLTALNVKTAIDELSSEKLDKLNGTATELTVNNNADGDVSLIVQGIDTTTVALQQWKKGSTVKATLDSNGYLYGPALSNQTSSSNALVSTPATGAVISRNIADADNTYAALKINNGQGSGDIVKFQYGGTTKAYVDKDGNIASASLITGAGTNTWSISDTDVNHLVFNNGTYSVTLDTDGIAANKTIAFKEDVITTLNEITVTNDDIAGIPLTVSAISGTTASLQEWYKGGSRRAYINSAGDIITYTDVLASKLINLTGGVNFAGVAVENVGTKISRNVNDADNTFAALRVDNLQGNGDIIKFKYAGTEESSVTKEGYFNKKDADTVIITQNGLPILSTFKHPTGSTAVPNGYNTFVGKGAGNTTLGSTATSIYHGSYNTGLGCYALSGLTTGYMNIAIGDSAGQNITTATKTVAIGRASLFSNNGSSNTAIGSDSGRFIADGSTANATGYNSVFLGSDTKANANGESNQIVIGYNAIGAGSNTVVLGNDSITKTLLKGIVKTNSHIAGANTDWTKIDIANESSSYDIRMYTRTSTGASAKRLTLTGGTDIGIVAVEIANVGIGTTNPGAKLDVAGDVKHTGLTMTAGTNVDQLKSTTFASALTTSWTDVTGVSGTYLTTGSYIVQIESNGEYYTGDMSWFSGATTSTTADEIELHRAGPAASAARLYARVVRVASGTLKLQVSASTSLTSHTMTFKFRRTI